MAQWAKPMRATRAPVAARVCSIQAWRGRRLLKAVMRTATKATCRVRPTAVAAGSRERGAACPPWGRSARRSAAAGLRKASKFKGMGTSCSAMRPATTMGGHSIQGRRRPRSAGAPRVRSKASSSRAASAGTASSSFASTRVPPAASGAPATTRHTSSAAPMRSRRVDHRPSSPASSGGAASLRGVRSGRLGVLMGPVDPGGKASTSPRLHEDEHHRKVLTERGVTWPPAP